MVSYAVMPLFHIGAMMGFSVPAMFFGATAVVERIFEPGAMIEALTSEEYGVTHFLTLPAIYNAMRMHPACEKADFSRIVIAAGGAEPMPEPVLRWWYEHGVPIVEAYGMTETTGLACCLLREDVPRRIGSAGKPALYTELKIMKSATEEAAPGEQGEIWMRGANVTPEYWRRPEANAEAFVDGWLKSGDIGIMDEEGYVTIEDRIKDMYISGGENVYPAEVESALYMLPEVAEAAVIGVPDPKWGETPLAFVELKPDRIPTTPEDSKALADELIEHCRAHLARFKCPREVRFEEVPKTSTGKIQKHLLRAQGDLGGGLGGQGEGLVKGVGVQGVGAPEHGGEGFDERTEIPDLTFDKTEQLRYEKEMLGLYVSDHPLFGVEAALKRKVEHSVLDLQTMEDGANVVVGGVITNLARKFTKKGDQMAVFLLEDLDASIEVTIFPRTLAEQGHKLEDDLIVAVKGRLDRRDESRFGLIGQTVTVLSGLSDGPAVPLRLRLPSAALDELKIQRLKRILREHPGDSVVMVDIGQGKVLKLADEFRVDPRIWLEPAERGGLLHAAFRRFMSLLREQGVLPDLARHEGILSEILEEEIDRWKDLKPAPNRSVLEREVMELRQASRIFLQEEEEFCKQSTPFCFEASVGLLPEGEGTPLDTLEPVELKLGGNRVIRVRGRIDRVDEVPESGGTRFSLWDYKTGGTWKYRKATTGKTGDPFRQGRLLQNSLYLHMAEARLKETVAPSAAAVRFGYFFPTFREHGERIQWEAAELRKGTQVMGLLCEMIASGAFPFTDDSGDVRFSDYRDAFGEEEAAVEETKRKLGNKGNETLEPFRRLRGYEQEE